jgi:uncharacterized hydrophobic protein (TIGR00271 family)
VRLIRILVPRDRLDAVGAVLDREDIDFVVTDERRGGGVLVEFPLPVQAVDGVMGALSDAGFDGEEYTVVANAETARTERFDELEARYVERGDETDRVAHAEVRSKARSLLPDRWTYYAMTVLSVLVATAGLLLDSPAVVIGSMAIAPQVGAAITASAGLVLDDGPMVRDGAGSLVLGLLVAVVGATAFGWLLLVAGLVPAALDLTTVEQISARISPGVLSVLLGLCAGAAAALGVATDLPLSLVGVAIAAAVVPAAAAVGIGVVWGFPVVALGAATLLVVNTASILLAGAVTLWLLGYRPETPEDRGRGILGPVREHRRVLGTVLVLLAVVAAPSAAIADHVAFENTANDVMQETLERPAYRDLSLVSVRAEFTDLGLLGATQTVTVRVTRPVDRPYPGLADELGGRLSERTGERVVVSVEFVEQQTG